MLNPSNFGGLFELGTRGNLPPLPPTLGGPDQMWFELSADDIKSAEIEE